MTEITDIMMTMEYGPAPDNADAAFAWLDAHGRTFGHFISGAWTQPAHLFATHNPATGEPLAEVSAGTPEDVDAAVAAARAAFPAWAALSGYKRARYLRALAKAVGKKARLFALLETLDNGRPITESLGGEIPSVVRYFDYFAGWAQLVGHAFPDRVAYGVCGQIIPWNFPTSMLAWKIAPALAAGNTVVLKPAELTPLTALLFAEICTEIGLPKGVINIVTGAGETGAALVAHDDVDKIAFTGSTEVGRDIRARTAGSGKGLSLELGGKSAFIVFEDADIDSAVDTLVESIFFDQGQICSASSRLLVHEAIANDFLARLKRRMNGLRVGDPMDASTDIGAMIAPSEVDRVSAMLDQGEAEGGRRYEAEIVLPNRGAFFKPTLVTDVAPTHTLVREEIFGPVLVAMSFRTPDEAVALANNTRYGLAANVWSENVNLVLDMAPKLKAGVVWINGSNMFDAAAGFGGYRESGFGRDGGRECLGGYLKPAFEQKLEKAPAVPAAPISSSGDVVKAVAAARKVSGWAGTSGAARAASLYRLGEGLEQRRAEFIGRLVSCGASPSEAEREVEATIERLFAFAGWADKNEGVVHDVPRRATVMAINEPIGVIGIAAPDEAPLLGAVSLLAPAIARGNTIVLIPSESNPAPMADFAQIVETAGLPGGVVNIVAGDSVALSEKLARHDGVDGLWFCGSAEAGAEMERLSIHNLKQVWTTRGLRFDWFDKPALEGDYFLLKATQVKNIWIPYGA